MRFGIVGLGRMGGNLARAAMEHGHDVVGYNRDHRLAIELAREGLEPASSLPELVSKLEPPRIALIYVPHGPPTEQVCDELLELLAPGDLAVDGGNSPWADSQRRHAAFAPTGIRFLDVGTSGGVWGARNGAGHFVKLIHNAIEFGMVQSITEGTEMLMRSEFTLDLPALFDNWNHGSVIRSWLIELMGDALEENADFDRLSTYVEDTGEVKGVLDWALERDIPSPVISDSQQALMCYRDVDWPAAKAVALLRHGYGAHPVHTRDEQPARESSAVG